MELTYDWRCFQTVFYSRRKPVAQGGLESNPVYVVVEEDTIISAFGEGEDFSEWLGSSYQKLAAEVTHREIVLFNREQVDQWLEESLPFPHYFDQSEFLRKTATPQILTRNRLKRASKSLAFKPGIILPENRHFLLEALQGWWVKVMPSSFGFFIRLEGKLEGEQDLFVLMRRGKIELFCEPDLSFMGTERRKNSTNIVKYLSEKYLVPVQGLFVSGEKWRQWSESENPWREVTTAIRANQAKLIPFRWSLVFLVSSRGFFGI